MTRVSSPGMLSGTEKVNPFSESNSCSRFSDLGGIRDSASVSHECGSRRFIFVVSGRLYTCVARVPAVCEPAKSHDFLPWATRRMVRSGRLLWTGMLPFSRRWANVGHVYFFNGQLIKL